MLRKEIIRPFTSSAVRKHNVNANIVTGKDMRNASRNNDTEELALLLDHQGKNSEIMDDTDNMGRSALWLASFKGYIVVYTNLIAHFTYSTYLNSRQH